MVKLEAGAIGGGNPAMPIYPALTPKCDRGTEKV